MYRIDLSVLRLSPGNCRGSYERRNLMLWTIIVILFILWLLGAFGGNFIPSFPKTGNWVHTLIVIVIILVILNLLHVI
jgi:fatty acid desaturase